MTPEIFVFCTKKIHPKKYIAILSDFLSVFWLFIFIPSFSVQCHTVMGLWIVHTIFCIFSISLYYAVPWIPFFLPFLEYFFVMSSFFLCDSMLSESSSCQLQAIVILPCSFSEESMQTVTIGFIKNHMWKTEPLVHTSLKLAKVDFRITSVEAHTYIHSTQEAKAGRWWVQG